MINYTSVLKTTHYCLLDYTYATFNVNGSVDGRDGGEGIFGGFELKFGAVAGFGSKYDFVLIIKCQILLGIGVILIGCILVKCRWLLGAAAP